MAQRINFGAGALTLVDSSGKAYQVGILKDVSLEVQGSTKSLVGSQQLPIANARAGTKVSGKATYARIDGKLIAALLPGSTTTTTAVLGAIEESHAAAASVTVSHSATFVTDLGVLDASGHPMEKVASNPTVGQYAVTAGVYTFNASESGTLRMTYSYSATGTKVSWTNQSMGQEATFQVQLFNNYTNDGATHSFGVKLFACIIPSFSMKFANEDFTTSDLSFEAQAASNGDVLDFYVV